MTEIAICGRLRPLVECFTSRELYSAAEVAWLVEHDQAERHVADLYALYFERPALGAYLRDHPTRRPRYPPDAPPLPPRRARATPHGERTMTGSDGSAPRPPPCKATAPTRATTTSFGTCAGGWNRSTGLRFSPTTPTTPPNGWRNPSSRGWSVAIWARAKVGKSLLLLDVCGALACGAPVLGGPASDPVHVVYVDMENPAGNVRARVLDLGYTASSDLVPDCISFHIPSMPPLDTDLGGAVLTTQVERFGAVLVVVDTTASSVGGGENDADTYGVFYRHTGRRLRSTGAALVRLDHGGKDRTRGQPGSSAKDDDVDVVFEMADLGEHLICTTRSPVPGCPPRSAYTAGRNRYSATNSPPWRYRPAPWRSLRLSTPSASTSIPACGSRWRRSTRRGTVVAATPSPPRSSTGGTTSDPGNTRRP